jgi:hypothetical protein
MLYMLSRFFGAAVDVFAIRRTSSLATHGLFGKNSTHATHRNKSVEEMASELRDEIGQNSVNFSTIDKAYHIDLAGRAHYDKSRQKLIPTPHVQAHKAYVDLNGKIKTPRKPTTTDPATKSDIRLARQLAEQQGLRLRR